mgnify:CR=1 FL=1
MTSQFYAYCDSPAYWQTSLQEPASITMEGILLFNKHLTFLLVVIVLLFTNNYVPLLLSGYVAIFEYRGQLCGVFMCNSSSEKANHKEQPAFLFYIVCAELEMGNFADHIYNG